MLPGRPSLAHRLRAAASACQPADGAPQWSAPRFGPCLDACRHSTCAPLNTNLRHCLATAVDVRSVASATAGAPPTRSSTNRSALHCARPTSGASSTGSGHRDEEAGQESGAAGAGGRRAAAQHVQPEEALQGVAPPATDGALYLSCTQHSTAPRQHGYNATYTNCSRFVGSLCLRASCSEAWFGEVIKRACAGLTVPPSRAGHDRLRRDDHGAQGHRRDVQHRDRHPRRDPVLGGPVLRRRPAGTSQLSSLKPCTWSLAAAWCTGRL